MCSAMGMTVHFSSAKGNHSILTLRVLVVFPAAHGDWQVDDTGRVTLTKGKRGFPGSEENRHLVQYKQKEQRRA